MTWQILYRGSLSSCNYACAYCPFAKTSNTPAELRQDEQELDRFGDWVAAQSRPIGLLFTPWGEALVHGYYRRTLSRLSRVPHVRRVAIQTNLSAPLPDLLDANRETLALWATFHPSQIALSKFVARCRELDAMGLRYSVGAVGLREHFVAVEELRAALRPEVYLWVNAFKREPGYYQPGEIERWQAIDPYFHWNLTRYPSGGRACRAGETSFTVDARGDVRRCHFISDVIGNIYEPDFAAGLKPRRCTAETCGCHIGYVHRPELGLDGLYGDGLLERIPARWPAVEARFASSAPRPAIPEMKNGIRTRTLR